MSRVRILVSAPVRRVASALLFAGLACAAPARAQAAECTTASFKVGQNVPTGEQASHTIMADFNGDGRPDLASASSSLDRVQVVIGQGADGFGPPTRFATGDSPFGLAAGDFDGDGRLDLVTSHTSLNILSVLLGDGAGNFAAPVTFQGTWSGGAGQPAAGDLNGDGRDDLAVGVGADIWILISNGAGGFTPAAGSPRTVGDTNALNGRVEFVRIADLNGDGKRDVVASGAGLNVLLGDGAGGFAAPVKLLGNTFPFSFEVADFNGDGRADLAASEQGFNVFAVAVLLGNGDGTFAAPLRHALAKQPSHLASADFNGDGRADLAVTVSDLVGNFTFFGASLLVLSGDGAGNFASTSPLYALPSGGAKLLPADFNLDGRPDLAAAGSNTTFIYYTGADGRPTAPLHVDSGLHPNGMITADFNNDGKADLAVTNNRFQTPFPGGLFSVHLGDGAGNFTRSANISTGLATVLLGMAAADFNGDGKTDLAVASQSNGETRVYLGNGDGTFTTGQTVFALGGGGANYIKAGDFDNDSKIDLLVYYRGPGTNAALFRGDGTGSFHNVTGIQFDPNGSFGRLNVGDLNGDGHLDAAFTSFHSQRVVVTFNDGFGNLSGVGPNALSLPLAGRGPLDVAAHDFNGDGKLDLAVASDANGITSPPGVVSVALNNGAGGFGAFTDYAVGDNPESLVVGEFTGDGFADIATSSSADAVSVLTGDGAGGFGPGGNFQLGDSPTSATNSVVTADFTGDGKNDIAVVRNHTSDVAVLVNNSAGDVPCVSVSGPAVTEGDVGETDAVFTVTLSEPSAQTVRVSYFFTDGVGVDFSGGGLTQFSAQNGIDYRGEPGTLVFAPGTTTQTITAKIIGDRIDEFDEPFDLNLSSAMNATLTTSRVVTRITDDDAPPAISISDASAVEGNGGISGGTAVFNVTLSGPSAKGVSVQFATAPGTASTNDYSTFINALTFSPGETAKTISVTHTPDPIHEPDETYFVNLSNPNNATLADAQGQGTITNDDPVPTVTVDSGFTPEGTGGTHAANLTVRLSNASSQTVTVNYATVDDTATAGSDYAAASGTLTFNPGETTKTVAVTIIEDSVDETNERFILRLSTPANATLGAETSVLIQDDDGPAISINDVTVTEGDPPGSTTATFTVSLSAASPDTVRVELFTANGTAFGLSDFQSFSLRFVTFTPGQTSAAVNVTIINDFTAEPDETFTVNLRNPENATIADGSGLCTITDNDVQGGVQFSADSYTFGEGDGTASITVTRTGNTSAPINVDYTTADADTFTVGCADAAGAAGNAFARCDFATAVGTLRFAANEATKTINVPVIDDAHVEGSQTFQLRLSNAVNATLGTQSVATVTITDNDTAGAQNPVLGPPHEFFVRQQYLDFLSREPDPAGFNAWLNVLNTCQPNANTGPEVLSGCDRIHVSGEGFFRSVEFQLKGAYVFRFYKVGLNRLPEYTEITSDMGFVAGATQQEVFFLRAELARRFVQRPEFIQLYGSMSNQQFVSALLARYNLTQVTTPDPSNPDTGAKVTLTAAQLATLSRAQALRAVADSDEVGAAEFNNTFVAMQYYGYLRRKPEPGGFEAWLRVLQSGDVRTMVNGFLNSAEYRLRFGQP